MVDVVLAAQLQNPGAAFVRVSHWFEQNRRSWPTHDVRSPVRQSDRTRRAVQLNDDQSQELAERYQAGDRVCDLAKDYGIHRTTVKRHLERHDVVSRFRGMTDAQIEVAKELYNGGSSLKAIANQLHVNDLTVRKRLADAGVTIRKKGL